MNPINPKPIVISMIGMVFEYLDEFKVTAKLIDSTKTENSWIIDTEMPILKGEDRAYVDDLVYIGE